MSFVIDVTDSEQTVKLQLRSLGDCAVVAPEWPNDYPLRRYYERPARAQARSFVNELLAVAIKPARRASEYARLSEADRARLRKAVAVSAARGEPWRRLYGSHLLGDERLFAVMFWRWQRWECLRRRLRDARLEQERATAAAVDFALGQSSQLPSISLVDVALYGDRASQERLATAVELSRSLPGTLDVARSLAPHFDSPVKLPELMRSVTSMTRMFDTLKLTSPFGVGFRPEPFNHSLRPGVFNVGFRTRAADLGTVNITAPSMAAGEWMSIAETVKSYERIFATGDLAAAVARLRLPLANLGPLVAYLREAEEKRELQEASGAVERFERRWQTHTFSYLVQGLLTSANFWDLAKLAALPDVAAVEEVVLHALEAVVCDSEFVTAMREEIRRAPHLNRSHRIHLDHMLEHAGERKWVHASAPLYAGGLEGAYWAAGYHKLVVTLDRTDPNRPTKTVEFESMLKKLPLPQQLKTLMTRGLYGTAGNPFRHGDADDGERQQVLLGVAALAGWFECFTDVPAFSVLIQRTARRLPEALKLQSGLPLQPRAKS